MSVVSAKLHLGSLLGSINQSVDEQTRLSETFLVRLWKMLIL